MTPLRSGQVEDHVALRQRRSKGVDRDRTAINLERHCTDAERVERLRGSRVSARLLHDHHAKLAARAHDELGDPHTSPRQRIE